MKTELISPRHIATIPMNEMLTGQIGVITARAYQGWIVIREGNGGGFLAFTTCGKIDGFMPRADHEVRILQPGEVVKITI